MNKIRLIASRETNYIYHMLSVARCGYDNDYSAKYRDLYPAEDLAILKKHEKLITCAGGSHWGGLYTLLLCYPAAKWQGTAKSYYLEIIRQADAGEVPDHYLPLAPAAREIASVMEKHYDHYTEHIWPEQRRILEAYCAQVTALFEESRFSERAEEAVGCALPAAAFHPTMVNSIEHGAEAIDISEDQDVFGIARDPETAFRFIGHEFIIYLLKHALREEDAFGRFETWEMTEALAEHYLKELTGQYFFTGTKQWARLYSRCAESGEHTAAGLYRKGMQIRAVIEGAMRTAIQEAETAKRNGENPYGAVLLDPEYRFCRKAHSRSVELSDPTAHAEIQVIREYCRELGKVYLEDYVLVCSGEPCVMCSGAVKWTRIGQIFYSVPQSEINRISGGKPKPSCESLINSGTSQKLIVGNVLAQEGLRVFDNYHFHPQDKTGGKQRKKEAVP